MASGGYLLNDRDAADFNRLRKELYLFEQNHGGVTGVKYADPADQVALRTKVTSTISGQGGRYNGMIFDLGVNAQASGNLAEDDLGKLPSSENCIIWNLSELGTSDQGLALPSYMPGILIGWDSDSGKSIVAVQSGGGGASLPAPTAIGQVPVCTATDGNGNYLWAWDYQFLTT